MGRVTQEHQGWASHYFDYDELGQVIHWQLPDGKKLGYYRHPGGQLDKITLNDTLLTRHVYQSGLEKNAIRATSSAVLSTMNKEG